MLVRTSIMSLYRNYILYHDSYHLTYGGYSVDQYNGSILNNVLVNNHHQHKSYDNITRKYLYDGYSNNYLPSKYYVPN